MVLSVLGAIVAGFAVAWWVTTVQRIPVRSDADLTSVPFGFPLPWVSQDHSSNPFATYPAEVVLRLTGRTGIAYPTEYEWLPFIADGVIWGAAFWLVGMVALPALMGIFRRE
ncbi:hypothetical protein [Microbacterium sp. CCH5-D1]|uniref:hypothetical protein n=1 Tax=Microbacterium sp. CCH5-D1 TaxID=1768780 RepID=UPI00076A1BFB|nr:hypothetical protein [Microbacterium sp. CCH5-D1]